MSAAVLPGPRVSQIFLSREKFTPVAGRTRGTHQRAALVSVDTHYICYCKHVRTVRLIATCTL